MATKISLLAIQIAWLATLPVRGGDIATNLPVNPWSFRTQVVTQSGNGQMETSCACISLGTNKVAFLVPEGYRVDISDPQTVRLASVDFSRVFTLHVNGPMPPETAQLDPDACRDQLLTTHPRAMILAQLGLGAANQFGPAFDLRWVPRGNVDRTARVAYIPSRLGILEFSMVSSPEKFSQAKTDLHFIMMTFRASGLDGKLTMPQLMDRI